MANIGVTTAVYRTETSLTKVNRDVSKSMERLATANQNANAGDRSSFSAMGDTFNLDIYGTRAGLKSASVALGYLETGMRVLDSASSLLARLQELAVLGANETNTTADHEAINLEAEAIGDEFNRLMSSSTYKGKGIFVGSANQSIVSLGGRGQASNFGIASIDYSNLYGTERTINFSDGPNHGAKVNLVTLPSEAVELPTLYLGTPANPITGGIKYQITDVSLLSTWYNNLAPNTELANVSWYLSQASDIGAPANVVVGAQFTGTANPWSANGDINRLKGALGVKEVKDPLTSIIENVQTKINTARVQAGSQYAAIESAINYSTDLTVQYELGKNVVSDLNFSSEAAHLAKSQILQDAASAMLIQANRGQRGLISLIS